MNGGCFGFDRVGTPTVKKGKGGACVVSEHAETLVREGWGGIDGPFDGGYGTGGSVGRLSEIGLAFFFVDAFRLALLLPERYGR